MNAFKTFISLALLVSAARAAIYVTNPVASTVCSGGQSCEIDWVDDGQSPLLSSIGECTVGLYNGEMVLVQSLQSVDVSSTQSLSFTPNPSAGPNGAYYLVFTSNSISYQAWSATFTLDSMTGTAGGSGSSASAGSSTVSGTSTFLSSSGSSTVSSGSSGTLTTSGTVSASTVSASTLSASASTSTTPVSTTSISTITTPSSTGSTGSTSHTTTSTTTSASTSASQSGAALRVGTSNPLAGGLILALAGALVL